MKMTNMYFNYRGKTRGDFLKDVVRVLREERKRQKISQETLNHKLGVADFLVGKWEVGIRSPTAFNLYCWADALGCEITVTKTDDEDSKKCSDVEKAINDNIK